MSFWIKQLPGIIAIILMVFAYHIKKKEKLLTLTFISKILWVIQYLLSGFATGAAMNLISAFRDVVYYTYAKKEIKKSIYTLILFQIIAMFSMIYTWKNIWSILPYISTMVGTWLFWQDNMRIIRKGCLLTLLLWPIYNFVSGVYVALISDFMCITSVSTAIWRYDIRKEKEQSI